MTSSSEHPPPRIQSLWIRVLVAMGLYLFGSAMLSGGLVAITFFKRFIPEGDPETWTQIQPDPKLMQALLQEPLAQLELLLGSALAAALVVWGMRRLVDRRSLKSLGWPGFTASGPAFVMGSFFGALLAVVSVLFISAIGHRHLRLEGYAGASGWALVFAAVIVLLSLCEEWFFRGYAFSNLRDYAGRVPAILWSAVFFAGLHLRNPGGGALALFNVFLLGLILGMLRDVTRSLGAGAGLHVAWNLVLGMVLGADVSGFTIPSLYRLHLDDLSPILGGGDFGPEGSVVVTLVLLLAGSWLLYRYLKLLSITLGGGRGSD